MTVKNQELYNVIEKLPEELSVKSIEDLREKLEEGRKDFESGNVCSLEEAYLEVQKVLAD